MALFGGNSTVAEAQMKREALHGFIFLSNFFQFYVAICGNL